MNELPRYSAKEHSDLLADGYKFTTVQTLSVYGARAYNENTYTKTIDMCCIEKVGRVFVGSLITLGTLGCAPCCINGFNENMFSIPLDGKLTKKAYVLDQKLSSEWRSQDSEKLGFDANDKVSIQKYVNANQSKFVQYLGHKFMTYHAPISKASSMIFVPSGDDSQAEVVALYNVETGANLTSAELRRTAMTYCENYKGEVAQFEQLRNPKVIVYGAIIVKV
jgi:hypothetical protein